ncbi:MAG: putative virulence factor [Deltaproteobacteria bacterium]|nr:putative virulence factor [Deltaproteobacteria bacterium]
MTPEELKKTALDLRDATLKGSDWLLANEAAQGNQDGVKKRLRRSARLLSNYANAAGSKMGIAVFGPSQVGKSTLISALAKGKQSGLLMVEFLGGGGKKTELDFIRQVNPQGGRETTGLVTRFSLESPPVSSDPDMSVCLKLFSEMDIIKILANTFFAEAEGAVEVVEEELDKVITQLESRASIPNQAPSLDDMEDLCEYVEQVSLKYPSGKDLSRLFWPRAIPLAQRLDVNERAQLFSFIWGRCEEFTRVYLKLYKALASVGFPTTAFTELRALYEDGSDEADARNKSVLHVSMLMGLLEDNKDTVTVMNPSGIKAQFERPVLSALIAELHVKVKESPGDFMLTSDILDFPGYRARKEYKNFLVAIKDPLNLKECFLRGKVAYVFQRYAAQKEITCMLLCLRDGNVDSPGLPEVINNWLCDTHGRTALERTGKPVCLFLVLTFFNMHLIKKEGSVDPSLEWSNRLHASIDDTFKKDGWPDNWSMEGKTPQPFKNCFWLLNVFMSKDYLDIEPLKADNESYISKGVKPEHRQWIEQLKNGYLATDSVNRYFQDPLEAWNAVLESPDGGTGYIISKLTPLVAQDLKTRQLADLSLAEGELVWKTLDNFYQGEGTEEQKKIKEKLFRNVSKILLRLGNPGLADGRVRVDRPTWNRFGLLLRDLLLTDDECHEFFSRLSSLERQAEEEQSNMQEEIEDDIFIDIDEPTGIAPETVKRNDDLASHYRALLEKMWNDRLESLASSQVKAQFYNFPQEDFRAFVSEILLACRRLKVMDHIEDKLRSELGYGNINPQLRFWKLARIASTVLSNFVSYLGYNPMEKNKTERTLKIQDRDILVFEPTPESRDFPELPEEAPAYENKYHNDWRLALFKIMLENVDFSQKNYDVEENERLGRILNSIKGDKGRLITQNVAQKLTLVTG